MASININIDINDYIDMADTDCLINEMRRRKVNIFDMDDSELTEFISIEKNLTINQAEILKKHLKNFKIMDKEENSSRFEFVFFDVEKSIELKDKTRALVKHKDGFLEMAIWILDSKKWIDEGSFNNCGGGGGDITDKVVEFALNGC